MTHMQNSMTVSFSLRCLDQLSSRVSTDTKSLCGAYRAPSDILAPTGAKVRSVDADDDSTPPICCNRDRATAFSSSFSYRYWIFLV